MKRKQRRLGIRGELFGGRGKCVNQASPYVDGLRSKSVSVVKRLVYKHSGQQIKEFLDEEGNVPIKDAVIELDGNRYRVLTADRSPLGPSGAIPVWIIDLEEL